MVLIDAQSVMQMCNRATYHMFGYQRRELQGKDVSILIPPPFQEQHAGYGAWGGDLGRVCRRVTSTHCSAF